MTIERCRRVIWRLEEMKGQNNPDFKLKDITRAIKMEIGLDQRTIDRYIAHMIELDLIKRHTRWDFTRLVGRHDLY